MVAARRWQGAWRPCQVLLLWLLAGASVQQGLSAGSAPGNGTSCSISNFVTNALALTPNSTIVQAKLPEGVCSSGKLVSATNLTSLVIAGSIPTEGVTTTILDLSFVTNALSLLRLGSRLELQSVTLQAAAVGPALLQLQSVTAGQVILTNVTIVTDCPSVLAQQKLATARGNISTNQGLGYLYIASYNGTGISYTNVNMTCGLKIVRSVTVPGRDEPTDVFVVSDSLSLYNAIMAVNYIPDTPNVIQQIADISVSRLTWLLPVTLTRSMNFTGVRFKVNSSAADNSREVVVNPMLDWQGNQQMLRVFDGSIKIWFLNIDQMNIPPLAGVYHPYSGMVCAFCLPFWSIWYDPLRSPRFFSPVYLTNVTLVVPPVEYKFWLALSAAVTSPLSDVVAQAASLRALFNRLVMDTAAPQGVLQWAVFDGVGLNATGLRVTASPPARIPFPRMFEGLLTPSFNIDLTKTPTLITTINVYTAEDLMTGLQGLQDSTEHEPLINIVLNKNISLEASKAKWPPQGYTLATNVTITGINPYWFNPQITLPPFTALDFALLPNLITINPGPSGPNTLTFAWDTLVNLPIAAGPLNNTSVMDTCDINDPWMVLGLKCFNSSRNGGLPENRGSTLVFTDASIVVPQNDWRLLAALVKTPSCAYANGTAAQLGSSVCSFDTLKTNAMYGLRVSATSNAPPGFVSQYPSAPPLPMFSPIVMVVQPPAPLEAPAGSSSSGLSSEATIGIAVGVSVGCLLVAALIAALVVRARRRRKALRNSSGSDKDFRKLGSAEQGSEGNLTNGTATSVVVVADANKSNTPGGKHDSQHHQDADGRIRAGMALEKLVDGKPHNSSEREATMSQSSGGTTPAVELQQVMVALAGDINDSHLMLLDAVGQGGFGTVYKGKWKGLLVAVKTLTFQDRAVADGKTQHTALMEAAISSSLAHPYVVTTYSFDIKPLKVDHPETTSGLRIVNNLVTDWKLYIIQEYCDAGSLRQAILKKWMWDKSRNQSDLRAVLECAIELASGLAHLHSHNIIHGDLNPNNVLLKFDKESRRGVVCKLCDFGLSVKMGEGQSHISNMRRGTPFYAAPEVMGKGNMTKAADVFSFGVMMWELFHSTTCYRVLPDRTFQQRESFPSCWPTNCPQQYAYMAEACQSVELSARPTMANIVSSLQALLLRVPPDPPPALNSSASSRHGSPRTRPPEAAAAAAAGTARPQQEPASPHPPQTASVTAAAALIAAGGNHGSNDGGSTGSCGADCSRCMAVTQHWAHYSYQAFIC